MTGASEPVRADATEPARLVTTSPDRVPDLVDHVVVGGGVAGCVLAARLTEDPSVTVLLLESGDDPDEAPEDLADAVRTPGLAPTLWADERVVYADLTVPQQALGGRRVPLSSGRGLGGGSTVNAMAWYQGFPADYDGWAASGATGWGWETIAPLLRAAEDHELGAGAHHGAGGPMSVSTPRHLHAAAAAFVQAAVAAGIEPSHDLNGERREGVGNLPVSMRDGARSSVVEGYLRPASTRPNLHVLTGQPVRRVLVEAGRAVGVLAGEGDGEREWRARRGVVLCAGALRTPQLLMLSGIGPADHLAEHGVPVVVNRPAVGANLHDHPVVTVAWPLVDAPALRGGLNEDPREVYRLLRRGPLAALGQTVAVTRSGPDAQRPDLHLILFPIGEDAGGPALPAPAVACSLALLDPDSRGTLRLASTDPADAPLIDPAYLTAPADRDRLHRGLELMRELFDTEPLAAMTGPRLGPAPGDGAAALDAFIDENLATYWHPVGTARVGSDDDAVVDPSLAVWGVQNLWVADASVVPRIPAAALQGPTIAIAERAARLLRAT